MPSKAYEKFCKWLSFRRDCDIIVEAEDNDDRKAIEEDALCDRSLQIYFCNIASGRYILFTSEEQKTGTRLSYETVYSDGDYKTYYGADGASYSKFRPSLGADSKVITTTESYTYTVKKSIKAIAVPRGEGKKTAADEDYLFANKDKYAIAVAHKSEADQRGMTLQEYTEYVKKQTEERTTRLKKRNKISMILFILFLLLGIAGSVLSARYTYFDMNNSTTGAEKIDVYTIDLLTYIPIACCAVNFVLMIILFMMGETEEKITAPVFEAWLIFYTLAIMLYLYCEIEVTFKIVITLGLLIVVALIIFGIVMLVRDINSRKWRAKKEAKNTSKEVCDALEAEKAYLSGMADKFETVLSRCDSVNSL